MFKIILGLLEYDNIKTGIGTQKKKLYFILFKDEH